MNQAHEREQPAVAAPEIKNASDPPREKFEQDRLTFRSMWNCIRLRKVGERVLRQLPEVAALRVHIRHAQMVICIDIS